MLLRTMWSGDDVLVAALLELKFGKFDFDGVGILVVSAHFSHYGQT